MKKVTRVLSLVVALCLAIGMCVSAHAEGPTEITFWNLLTGSDGEKMVAMVDEFNNSQSDYHISSMTLEWGDSFYTKLRTSVMGGVGPDMALSHYPYVPTLAKEGVLVPLDDYVEKLGMSIDYGNYAGMIEDMKYDGHYYAVPLEQNIVVLWYNKELCEKAGLLDEQGNLIAYEHTIDGFCELLEKAKESIGGKQPLIAAEKNSPPFKLFASIYHQIGGKGQFVNENGEWDMDHDIAIKALEMWERIYSYHVVNVDNGLELFAEGEIPFMISGNWDTMSLRANMGEDKVGVEATPQVGEEFYTHVLGHSFILPNNPNRTDDQVKGIITWINWFAAHNDEWSEAGSVPAYIPAAQTELFQSYTWLKKYSWAGSHGLPLTYGAPFSLSSSAECVEPLGKLARGESTPEECYQEMASRMKTAMQ